MIREVFLDEAQVRKGIVNFPLIFQRESLGLEDSIVEELKGKRVLDIGCGSEARLVRYLRQNCVDAEGIDQFSSSDPYILNQIIFPTPIPRESGTYDLVVAHSLDIFDSGLTKYGQIQKRVERAAGIVSLNLEDPVKSARFVLCESLRVLKTGGRLITRPALDIERLKGYEISKEDIRRTTFREEGLSMYAPLVYYFSLSKDFFKFMEQRTIIGKNS